MDVVAVAEERTQWPTKGAFVLAAVGAGFGSLFRFPFVALRHGGAPFVYAYALLMVTVGFPVLVLELALGQVYQQGAPRALKKVHPALAGVGYLATLTALAQGTFLCVASCWSVFYFFGSFTFPLPWHDCAVGYFLGRVVPGLPTPAGNCPNATTSRAEVFSPAVGPLSFPADTLLWQLLAALGLAWTLVFAILFRGVRGLAVVLYGVIPLALVVLIVLLGRALALSGAGLGVQVFLEPRHLDQDWASASLWLAALAQTCSSLGLGTGVMPAMASHNRKSSDLVKWAVFITGGSFLASFLVGLATLAVLGHLGYFPEGILSSGVRSAMSGPELLFVALPEALVVLPKGVGNAVAAVLFAGIFVLAVVTGWSYTLALTTLLGDLFPNLPDALGGLVCCLAGLLMGLPYCFTHGYFLLEVMNYFVPTFCVAGVVMLECFGLGYLADSASLLQKVREKGSSGLQRGVDFVSLGWFHSVGIVHERILAIEKTRVPRFAWCVVVKYVVPWGVLALLLAELVRLLGWEGGLSIPGRPIVFPVYIIAWGWAMV
eukprot:RCo051100